MIEDLRTNLISLNPTNANPLLLSQLVNLHNVPRIQLYEFKAVKKRACSSSRTTLASSPKSNDSIYIFLRVLLISLSKLIVSSGEPSLPHSFDFDSAPLRLNVKVCKL